MKPAPFFASLLLFVTACQKSPALVEEPRAEININFTAKAGADDLNFNRQLQNRYGELFTVTAFKYYLHGIKFSGERGFQNLEINDGHVLIDHEQPAATILTGILPHGVYNKIELIVGVDSSRNYSGAQTGALDPLHGMFWTWSSGYIMAKLEGNSPVAATINNAYEYHIGGFSGNNNVLQKISLNLPTPLTINSDGASYRLSLNADVMKWFEGANVLKIADDPVIIMPGSKAVAISANYAQMFSAHIMPD